MPHICVLPQVCVYIIVIVGTKNFNVHLKYMFTLKKPIAIAQSIEVLREAPVGENNMLHTTYDPWLTFFCHVQMGCGYPTDLQCKRALSPSFLFSLRLWPVISGAAV